MNIFIKFFTEEPSKVGFFYIVFGISLLTYIIFRFLPEEKSKKFFKLGSLYDWNNKYDYQQTIKKLITFALSLLLYSSIILVLSHLIGDVVANIGLWVFFPLTLVLIIIRGDVVEKKN